MDYKTLLMRTRGTDKKFPLRLLCLDPGETTGWALFEAGELTSWGQANTLESWETLEHIFMVTEPTHVVYENYRVYAHKLDRHTYSEVFTIRLIGVIDYLCWRRNIPTANQMAATAKNFCTDARLKEWGFWKEGIKHSRDAIRHGCYFLLFNKTY